MGRAKNKILTPKQENFCLAYLETQNGQEAYKIAYPAALKWQNDSVRSRAREMLNDSYIMARINELRAPAVKKAQITYESHLADLKELRDEAKEKDHFGPAITAEISRGKAAGFYVEKVEVKNIYEEMPADARKERIKILLEKALAAV